MENTLFRKKKTQLRREIIGKIANMSCKEKQHHAENVCQKIILTGEWQGRTALFAYYPFGDELDIRPLLEKAWEQYDVPLALPRLSGKTMIFHRVTYDNRARMQADKWGIKEPLEDWEILKPNDFEQPLMIVPGLGFTESGKRLGRGGGFYDRYLSQITNISAGLTKWAAAYPCQVYRDIPTEPHDISLNRIFY